MSVINRMLQDLDRRHALATPAPAGVAPVAPGAAGGLWKVGLLAVLAVGACLALWQQRVGADARGVTRATADPPAAARSEPLAPRLAVVVQTAAPPPAPTPVRAAEAAGARAAPARAAAVAQVNSREAATPAALRAGAVPADAPPGASSGEAGAHAPAARRSDEARPGAGAAAAAAPQVARGVAPAFAPQGRSELAAAADNKVKAGAVTDADLPAGAALAPETGKWSSSGEAAGAAAPGRISKTPRLPAGRAERAELAYREGRAALQAGRVRAAVETLQGALAEQPGHQAARETLARALIGERRLDEAQTVLRDGLALDPAAAALAHWLARILLAEAQPDAALGAIDALPAAALRAEDHALRGGLLDRLKRPQEAAAAYRAALAARPGEALWWLGLGVALDAAGQSDAARAALQQARALGGLNAELTAYVDRRLN